MVTLDARVALSVLLGCRLKPGAFGFQQVNTPARLVQSLTESKPPRQPAASNRIPEGLAVPGRWRKAVHGANTGNYPWHLWGWLNREAQGVTVPNPYHRDPRKGPEVLTPPIP